MERRLLQIVIAVAALVPVTAGAAGVFLGGEFLGLPFKLLADSHIRYLSGLLLGIGLMFWALIPRVESSTAQFSTLTLLVFVGGLSRLLGLIAAHIVPNYAVGLVLAMELIVTPTVWLWQRRVARVFSQ